MYNIKLCPFCGGNPYLETAHRAFIDGQSTRVAFVRCIRCNSRSARFKLEDYGHTSRSHEAEMAAIEAWNARSGANDYVEYKTKDDLKLEKFREKKKAEKGYVIDTQSEYVDIEKILNTGDYDGDEQL